MNASRRNRPLFAALPGLLVMTLAAGGCAMPPPQTPPPARPPAVALGPCGLVVANAYGDSNMQPPYEIRMIFRPSGDEARITVTGTGWGPTRFNMTGPGKTLAGTIGDGTPERGSMNIPGSWIMPAVGTWHFHFADAHCIREFDVVVKPRV